jgi:peptidyl-prolyl cis-trans isomerase D
MQSPELQTDGKFDIAKYQRLLNSPAARQQGLLLQLENFYRTEIPRAKLYDQLGSDVYVSDTKLWNAYRDSHDSAQVSYVTFDPVTVADSAVKISDDEMRRYYERNKARLERPGRAVVSLLTIPRKVTAGDSTAVMTRALALREEILKGAKFEEVATRESADSGSAANGGSLGTSGRGRYLPDFEKAAYVLKPGEISPPVLTSAGYHLIKLDSRTGDSITVRHILLRIQQSDSSARITDRLADQLARLAASSTDPARYDTAVRNLKLTSEQLPVQEGQPLVTQTGATVPSVSAWAFSGVRKGETSELFDADNAYYLARLDSLEEGGVPPFAAVKDQIRANLIRRKKSEALVPQAAAVANDAKAGGLEAAAKAHDITVRKTESFARAGFVQGLGRLNEAIGAAFALPVGTISAPVVTDDAVFVLRVDRRVEAKREEWEKQKDAQRRDATNALRQIRVRNYMDGLRKKANVKDKRKALNAAAKAQTS